MPRVVCEYNDCIYFGNCECKRDEISIDCDGCQDYTCYTDTVDYQSEYWIHVTDKDKKHCRAKTKGKIIIVNNIEFFTQSNPRKSESATYLTDARTGVHVGSITWLKEHWSAYITATQKYENIMELPNAVFDEQKRQYITQEE